MGYKDKRERKLRRTARMADGHLAARWMVTLAPRAKLDRESLDRIKTNAFEARAAALRSGIPGRIPGPSHRGVALGAAAVLVALVVALCVSIPLMRQTGVRSPAVAPGYGVIGSTEGTAQVRDALATWHAARPGMRIESGSAIRTASGNAMVVFEDGSMMRVTDGSEAKVEAVGRDSVKVEHIKGGTYHRVQKGTSYTVVNGAVALHALGTAFNVENRVPDNLEIVMVENAVEVDIGKHGPLKVAEGEVMVVSHDEKKADKQPVSRERLEEKRLLGSAQQDARAGYSTGVYQKLEVSLTKPPEQPEQPEQPGQPLKLELSGNGVESGALLSWSGSAGTYGSLVLLRSEKAAPAYPADEIARYSDTSITSAKDDSAKQGNTYQYRLAALKTVGADPIYSNTIVLTIPDADSSPRQASIKLVATPAARSVSLEWSVSGTSIFDGYVLERTVEGAPPGSSAPGGRVDVKRLESKNILYSYTDDEVLPGHKYSYRVGLVVDGTAMVYSDRVSVEVSQERKIN